MVFYYCKGVPLVQYHWCSQDFDEQPTLGVGYWSVRPGEMDALECAGKDNPLGWVLPSRMRQPRSERARLRLRLQERIVRVAEDEPHRNVLIGTVRTHFHLSERDEAEERRSIGEELDRDVREEML